MQKNREPTLDIGSHINAKAHLLPEAGATQERTLEAVRYSAVLGAVPRPQTTAHVPPIAVADHPTANSGG